LERSVGITISAVAAVVGSSLLLWIVTVNFLAEEFARRQTGDARPLSTPAAISGFIYQIHSGERVVTNKEQYACLS
jgi:hypothetical protein